MMRPEILFLILACQFGLSIQEYQECEGCNGGERACDTSKNCTNECIAGYYGDKCTEKCLKNCKSCINASGCTECKPGYYNYECNLPCGKGCVNNTCNFLGGKCPCKSTGLFEDNCKVCLGNKYGEECNNTCPNNCVTCLSETECSFCINRLYYGTYCQYRCSTGCDPGKCDKVNGHCLTGCKPGYTGDKCESCSLGFYGKYCDLNCAENCSSCLSKTNCTECNDGLYGENCTLLCPSGCEGNCLINDGRCLNCKPGFYGEWCNNTCLDRTYGYNCSRLCKISDFSFGQNHSACFDCPSNCRDKECNTLGLCSNGCLRGKWGDDCSKFCTLNCVACSKTDGKCLECTNETFSHDCSRNCSSDCNITGSGRICASDTGKCLHGCQTFTKYGDYCEKECNDNCVQVIEGTGSEYKLKVVLAASAGASVAFIIFVVILAICLFRRKRKQRLTSDKICKENDYIHDMQEIRKQNDYSETEADVTYAQPFKAKRERVNGKVKEYDTARDNEMRITDANNDYAIVNKEKSNREKDEVFDEVYDSTHDDKNKRPFNSNNDYVVLSLKFNTSFGIGKQNGAQFEDGNDTYDTTEENKNKNIVHLDNNYASINCNEGDKDEIDKTSQLYDTTNEDTNKKNRKVNNDYDVFTMDSEQTSSK